MIPFSLSPLLSPFPTPPLWGERKLSKESGDATLSGACAVELCALQSTARLPTGREIVFGGRRVPRGDSGGRSSSFDGLGLTCSLPVASTSSLASPRVTLVEAALPTELVCNLDSSSGFDADSFEARCSESVLSVSVDGVDVLE